MAIVLQLESAQQYSFDDDFTISQDTKCVYMMLSQWPISCVSEVLSPVPFQQSLFLSQNYYYNK